MRSPGGVAGVMVVHNEWPLLAASASHLLSNLVDELWVLDHQSTDQTSAGLSWLQTFWGERLNVVKLGEVPFLQAAINASVAELIRPKGFEWLYFVDADEFALCSSGSTLRQLLANVPHDVDAVRYQVENWLAPRESPGGILNSLPTIRFRATPNVFVYFSGSLLSEQIESREINFFDVPFGSKLIVRPRGDLWVSAGAHAFGGEHPWREQELDRERFRVAHLPLLSYDRLVKRAEEGRHLIDQGFDHDHGWQSQMMARLVEHGELDSFWDRHSIGPEPLLGGALWIEDDELAQALSPVVANLQLHGVDTFERPERTLLTLAAVPHDAMTSALLRTTLSLQQQLSAERLAGATQLREHRESLIPIVEESAMLRLQRDELVHDRDAIRQSRTWIWVNRAAGVARFVRRLFRRV